MRKWGALVIGGALLISLATPVNAAAPKAGATCTKKNAMATSAGKLYTCILSGKKLVWNKGVAIPKPTPTPTKPTAIGDPIGAVGSTPTPSPSKTESVFTPWSLKFETTLMTQTALNKTSDYFGKVTPSNAYDFNLDPLITESDKSWITSVLDYANGSFSNINRKKVIVYLGTSHDWSASKLRNSNFWRGESESKFPCSDGLQDAYCADDNIVLLIYSDVYKLKYQWDIGRKSTPAHEIFHTVQSALTGTNVGPESVQHIPRWLNEGSANYFGYYVIDKLGMDKYQYGRNSQVVLNRAYRTLSPLSSYDNFQSDPYGIGQAASEYLIASIGFENFLNIWRFTKSESSFSLGFRKATGIELEDFYQKFEQARSSMQIGSTN